MKEPVVVHWEPFPDRSSAMKGEKYYKSGAGYRLRKEIIKENSQLFLIHE